VTSWKLPVIVAGITVPIIAAFAIGFMLGVGGSGVGLAMAALVTATIVVVAVRQRPRGRIDSAPAADRRRHVLLVTTCRVEEPKAVERVARAGHLRDGSDEEIDVLVLAPTRFRFLDRWASDVEPARRAAQQNLVATVAGLAKAGIEAEARVGDEDLVQAVEDQLQTFPATEVILASCAGGEEGDPPEKAIAELGDGLAPEFRHVVL
jgi:hypothetical protein